jgi:hypothetical protein
MSKRNIYFILAILGILLPYSLFLPWLFEHGLDIQLFFSEIMVNDIARTTALDFIVVSLGVIAFIVFETKKLGMKHRYLFILATLVAVGFGLALFLYMRERFYEKE